MRKQVVIIDFELGNLFSVNQACEQTGIQAVVSYDRATIEAADALILPGVGAFQEAMQNLEARELIGSVKTAVEQGKPLFGICLGLQLLFDRSEEFGDSEGLGLVKGQIRKFPTATPDNDLIKVPHVGWSEVRADKSWANTPMATIPEEAFMYFVHSYYVDAEEAEDSLCSTSYEGIDYCCGVAKGNNLFATQFHPEKSSAKGLEIYRNWAEQHGLI